MATVRSSHRSLRTALKSYDASRPGHQGYTDEWGKAPCLEGGCSRQRYREILDKVANAVQAQKLPSQARARHHYQNGLEWDKLCVVMYGPTNSGKSTIIEALSCGDGRTIGTGEKDYTLKSREIQFGPLLLVDTPGIEGGEGELRLEHAGSRSQSTYCSCSHRDEQRTRERRSRQGCRRCPARRRDFVDPQRAGSPHGLQTSDLLGYTEYP